MASICQLLMHYRSTISLAFFVILDLLISDHRRGMAFVTTGFSNWNDGSRKFDKHQKCASHLDAVASLEHHGSGKVDELLDRTLKLNKIDAHDMLSHVIEAIRYLARQGLPLRGTYHADSDSSEPDSNFWQALKSYTKFSEPLAVLMKRTHTYTSPDVQNELLNIMSDFIQREVVTVIKRAKWYSLMLDETPDISGKEQLVICFW